MTNADWVRLWAPAWAGIGAAGDGAGTRDGLLARYAEPQRAYHTTQHLAECLELCDEFATAAERPAEVALALWFHDAVYDVRASDNEARSAALAVEALTAAGVAADAVRRVRDAVLATRHSGAPATADERLVVDVDLAILGAPATRFAEYEAQIRREYAFVPESLFRAKRREILRGFLARPSVYATAPFVARFEAAARRNLAQAVGDGA